jgi:aryl-phospho-beta-D-glucosidase BglC (GH1 family)
MARVDSRIRSRATVALVLLGIVAVSVALTIRSPTPASAAAVTGLRVQANRLLDASGQVVRLHGVNYFGTTFACIQGWGIFSGPTDQAAVDAMKAWKINAVRLPLNEDCWLGINGVPAEYAGANYQQAIQGYVNLLNQNGLYAILDLHWSAPGTTPATSQQPMPDMDHSPTFWSQVAEAYKGNDAVILELFNQPWPDDQRDSTAAWTCWRDGGTCPGVSFEAAGVQTLVNTVRATGATNVIAVGGVSWSNALSRWLEYRPSDPLNNLVAAWHVHDFNICSTVACYEVTAGAVAAQVPLVVTEMGTAVCDATFMTTLWNWLDAKSASYMVRTWDVGSGCPDMALHSDYYAGTPTAYGQVYKDHLALAATPPPTPTPTSSDLHVQGNRLFDSGQPVVLRGVSYSGTAYACIQGWGIFSGPSDQAAVNAIMEWKINTVRLPLNEDCWLGINGVPAEYAGANYQSAIKNFVDLLNRNGLYVILDLHWSAPGTTPATSQQPMADMDHTPDFWTSVATVFKGHGDVIFEPFNEPWPENQADSAAAWRCWRDGGSCGGVPYQAAGMQTLVNAIRATGATNVIALGGVSWSNALSRWLEYRPSDPLNNVVAAWHVYDFNVCSTVACYEATAGPVASQVPIVVTEMGTAACDGAFMTTLWNWLGARSASYVVWTWDVGSGCSDMALHGDYSSGTPTQYGQIYKDHLSGLP